LSTAVSPQFQSALNEKEPESGIYVKRLVAAILTFLPITFKYARDFNGLKEHQTDVRKQC